MEPYVASAALAGAVIGLVILVVLALPFFSLRLGVADAGNDPTSFTTRRAYDLLTQGFGPGFNGPLLLTSELRSPQDSAAMARLGATIARDPDVAQVSPPITSPNGRGALLQVISKGSPQDQSTTELVHRLRDVTVPTATRGSTLDVHVGGQTAVGVDLADTVGQRLPYMFLAILLLSFVLLMLVFRSLLVPLKAVIMNLLSIGAAYGVIVAIFQWGWLKDLVGIGKEGPIEAWVPMMLFAIVFGLSMDYEVFLLSRIKEEYDRTHDNATAVAHGLAQDRTSHHRRRRRHDLRLRQLRALRPASPEAHRPRPGLRRVHRRHRRATRARPGHDGAPRRPQLVVPEGARLAPADPDRGRTRPRHQEARPLEPVAGR